MSGPRAVIFLLKVKNNRNLLEKARNYAFLLLKFRLHSEHELYERLKKRKFEEGVIRGVLEFLKDKNFIDDNLFTKTWIESRLKKHFGLRRLKQELRIKGINKEIIDGQISELKKNYSESEIVVKIAKERLNKLKDIEPHKASMRVYGYLLRRGFPPEIVSEILSQACKHSS